MFGTVALHVDLYLVAVDLGSVHNAYVHYAV